MRPPVWSARSALFSPEKTVVNLPRSQQILQLLQACKGAVLEDFGLHVNPLEQIVKLLRPAPGVPRALEVREMFADFGERHPVAAVVRAWRPKRELATFKSLRHDFGDFPDPVVVVRVTHVKGLIMHGLARRVQRLNDRP